MEHLLEPTLFIRLPGDGVWHNVNGITQPLLRLGIPMPQFTKTAYGLVYPPYSSPSDATYVLNRLRPFLTSAWLDSDPDSYQTALGTAEMQQTLHYLVDASLVLANNIRGCLRTVAPHVVNERVTDVVGKRNDVVIAYEDLSCPLHAAPPFPRSAGAPDGFGGGLR